MRQNPQIAALKANRFMRSPSEADAFELDAAIAGLNQQLSQHFEIIRF
jgi:hypothetical protein